MESNGNAATAARFQAGNSIAGALGGSTTTTTFPISGNLGGTTAQLNTNWNGYTYWPQWYGYQPDYTLTSRIASLEGEVKVLREMVAALLSGRDTSKAKTRA